MVRRATVQQQTRADLGSGVEERVGGGGEDCMQTTTFLSMLVFFTMGVDTTHSEGEDQRVR
jgi:hypothetical protein